MSGFILPFKNCFSYNFYGKKKVERFLCIVRFCYSRISDRMSEFEKFFRRLIDFNFMV